ncbi:MAG: FtsW/RodA/SpoVE family cell cycle protein [Candidatus Moraniibacteriota bacterium]
MFQGHRSLKRAFIVFLLIAILGALGFGVYWSFLHTAPTCMDGKQNGRETGVDCGGVCSNACMAPIAIQDLQITEVALMPGGTGKTDALGVIYNPNDTSGASRFSYTFEIKDASGQVVATQTGTNTILPQERKTLLAIGLMTPQASGLSGTLRVGNPEWEQFSGYQSRPNLNIYNRRYTELGPGSGPGFSEAVGLVSNESPYDFRVLTVVVVLRDTNGKPLAANSTQMNTVASGEQRDFRLVWPEAFPGAVTAVDMTIDADAYHSDNFVKQYLPGGTLPRNRSRYSLLAMRFFFKLDWALLIAILFLALTSLLILFGLSSGGGSNYFLRQAIFLGLGFTIFFLAARLDYRHIARYSTGIYFLTILVLLAVLFFGATVRGTAGWLSLGIFQIQPVELAKLSLIIFLASFISQKKSELGEWTRIIASLLLSAVLIFLVLRQPDLGSSLVLMAIWGGMILASGIRLRQFLVLALLGTLLCASSWFFLGQYQKDRINTFLHPQSDPRGSGYNVIQSIVAVGSGGVTGKGIGQGTQSQLNFLPEKHTDFIFAAASEEMGLLGASLILAAYGVLFTVSGASVRKRAIISATFLP